MRLWLVHLARWGLLSVIVAAIHVRHLELTARPTDAPAITASLTRIQEQLPGVAALGPVDKDHAGRSLLDATGKRIGFVVETSPQADDIIGYGGPNNVLLVFGKEGRLAGTSLLSSGDTAEHVEKVRDADRFWKSFEGKTWSELARTKQIDGVTGATLTSLAIVEGIVTRLHGAAPNLLFPKPPTLEEAAAFFPKAQELVQGEQPWVWIARDAGGNKLGYLLRSSPRTDQRLGYQGPTDGLLALKADGKTIAGIGIHKSYDNKRYVENVLLAWGFMHRFNGMPLREFAGLTVGIAEDVEGVSGATRTSQTLIRNLRDRARQWLAQRKSSAEGSSTEPEPSGWWQQVNWPRFRASDYGVLAVILFGGVMAFTNWRGSRASKHLRRAWQVVLIVYLGLTAGAFVSQSLLVGWARGGQVPWQLAPGLVLLAAAALVVPLFTRRNIYCHQLCPHGAAQELLKRRIRWQPRIPRRMQAILKHLPAALLVFVFLVTMVPLSVNLAGVEAFDAWLWRTAGWVSIAIALVGLVASLFVPMAYCRYGCPTGALLGYLRRNSHSDRLTRKDALAAALAVAGLIIIAL